MKNSANGFKLSPRGVMLALVSAALSDAALANTGHVDFAIGNVVVTESSGRVRPLLKGAEVGSGDKITSGADGRAQIRFSDGAYMSIQPNTEFDIKQYRFDGKADGTESALFGLFKGALRTVTGLVGRIHKDKYQITTPTATIGIRGTGGLIQVANDGSTLVIGTSGIWSLTNNGGSLDVPAGTAGFAGTNRNVAPQQTTQGPVIPPPQPTQQPPQPTVVQGDVVNDQGAPVSLFGPTAPLILFSGPGYAVAFAGATAGPPATSFAPTSSSPSTMVFDASGRPTQFTAGVAGPVTVTLAGSHNEFGTDGVLAWDRWTGTVNFSSGTGSPSTTFSANEGLHIVAGLPTPVASMPTGVIFTYNLLGATAPTVNNGTLAAGTFSGTLVGDFINNKVGLTMTVTMPTLASAYNIQTTGFTVGGANPSGLSITGSGFSGSISTTISGSNCTGGCTTAVTGGFAGTGATDAGLAYSINDPMAGRTIYGAAAFKR